MLVIYRFIIGWTACDVNAIVHYVTIAATSDRIGCIASDLKCIYYIQFTLFFLKSVSIISFWSAQKQTFTSFWWCLKISLELVRHGIETIISLSGFVVIGWLWFSISKWTLQPWVYADKNQVLCLTFLTLSPQTVLITNLFSF